MKKLLALLLLLTVLLCSCAGAFATEDDGSTYIDVTLLGIFDYSADQWMEDEFNRALYACCALLDYSISDSAEYSVSNLYAGTTYVGRTGNVIVVGFNDPDNSGSSVFVLYDTTVKAQALCGVLGIGGSSLGSSFAQICENGYYKVDPSDLKTIMDIIQEALAGS